MTSITKRLYESKTRRMGSVISFVKFKNGKVRAKSKTSFTSDQAQAAQAVVENNKDYYEFIEACLDMDVVPIFELVGPENQIVLEYHETELRLLQFRNNLTGEYIHPSCFNIPGTIAQAEEFPESMHNLEDLLNRKELDQSHIEGWVVTFEDGQMAKIKTDKYLQLHGLVGPDAFRENLLVETILDGNIDDVISHLVPGTKKDKIIVLDRKVTKDYNNRVTEFIGLRGKFFNQFAEDRKKFAMKHAKDPMFSFVMRTANSSFRDIEKTAEDAAKDYILNRCKKLKLAKEYIESL